MVNIMLISVWWHSSAWGKSSLHWLIWKEPCLHVPLQKLYFCEFSMSSIISCNYLHGEIFPNKILRNEFIDLAFLFSLCAWQHCSQLKRITSFTEENSQGWCNVWSYNFRLQWNYVTWCMLSFLAVYIFIYFILFRLSQDKRIFAWCT